MERGGCFRFPVCPGFNAVSYTHLVEKHGSNIWFELSDEDLCERLGLPKTWKKGKDTPVSYTHLDVYKRQSHVTGLGEFQRSYLDFVRSLRPHGEEFARFIKPVSYTHLDVYKRQGMHSHGSMLHTSITISLLLFFFLYKK